MAPEAAGEEVAVLLGDSYELSMSLSVGDIEPDNVNDHRAAAIDLQAEKAARPAAPCASYCYPTVGAGEMFEITAIIR